MMVLLWFACGTAPVSSDPVHAMRSKPVTLTRHAECRMACRHIDRADGCEESREGDEGEGVQTGILKSGVRTSCR